MYMYTDYTCHAPPLVLKVRHMHDMYVPYQPQWLVTLFYLYHGGVLSHCS